MIQAIPADVELLTRNDLAKILKCTTRTVANMEQSGRLPPSFSIGNGDRARRWKKSVVLAWIDAQASGAPEPFAAQ